MVAKLCVRFSPKTFALCAIAITVLLCIYYTSYVTDDRQNVNQTTDKRIEAVELINGLLNVVAEKKSAKVVKQKHARAEGICPALGTAEADVNTVDEFKNFEFQPTWMRSKEYWDKHFEDRYEMQKMDSDRPPLKVIIVPHSHNDPGWLKTFEHYFNYQSRQIMNHMVSKLHQYKNLTFIWSEVAFLNAWWEGAHPNKQRALKQLAQSGRLEITTGGWVMTDEANAHVYAMVDQLIEGHQWILKNLGIKPKSGWSIDPFGHGSTQPYLLAKAGITGTVIQRIHYAWKQWLALKQFGDFKWIPNWTSNDKILTHNQPFDIYSIKHSCGPHPYICLNFDFRKVQGEYTEYSIKAQPITDKNVKEKSELLLEQYARTGSLFPHNVVLMPLGDDFRYNMIEEWDQQYTNYIKLMNYINANKHTYKAEVVFGTPADYFKEIQQRLDQFPTLRGDFFVYSDIFSEGRPAYWSGYFTTRPFMKILDRELENSLRSAEILYTVALNNAKKNNLLPYLKLLDRDFEKLVQARRNLGLFQHHDAITGTSKSFVMRDYGLKLFESLRDTMSIQQNAIQSLVFVNTSLTRPDQSIILSDIERDSLEKLPKKTQITIEPGKPRQIILFNSLAQPQDHLVQLRITTTKVKVVDDKGQDVVFQINPVWNCTEANTKIIILDNEYELVFIAKLAELSIVTYTISYHTNDGNGKLSEIYCNKCHRKTQSVTTDDTMQEETFSFLDSIFTIRKMQPGDIQLENQKLKILFNGNSGFMKSVTRKHTQKITHCAIQFAAYKSAQFHSGAYLFMPDPNEHEIEKDALFEYKKHMSIIITSGAVSSELTVFYGAFLVHTVRILHIEKSPLSDGIYIENEVDFESPPKNRETELFMRIISDVQNGDPPEFYSDLNGFQMQKRVKVERIGIEGNYFPITTMAYIQDDTMRLSLLTNHAQGAASWQPGYLEVMLDRRTLYDDSRGMGEGLIDNRKTINKFWLLLEDVEHIQVIRESYKRFENENSGGDDVFEKGDVVRSFNMPTEGLPSGKKEDFSRPSLYANQMSNALNYHVNIFILESDSLELKIIRSIRLINKQLPCDMHLLTLRTQPDVVYSQFPSSNALFIIHRQGYDCSIHSGFTCDVSQIEEDTNFMHVKVKTWKPTGLSGISQEDVSLNDLSEAVIPPMSLQTYNISLF